MSDITSTHLEAAIIDQTVAGEFAGKTYAFVAVALGRKGGGYQLGVAVANEAGFNPINGKTFDRYDEAKRWASELNKHIGLSEDAGLDIISSTMGGGRCVGVVAS
jgi:hypothetical protein